MAGAGHEVNHADRGLRTLASHREPFVPVQMDIISSTFWSVPWRNSNELGKLLSISLCKTCDCYSSFVR